MEISIDSGPISEKGYQLLALGLFEGVTELSARAKEVDGLLGNAIASIVGEGEFKARQNQTYLIPTLGKIGTRRILLVGLGKEENLNLEVARSAAGRVARVVSDLGLESYAIELLGEGKMAPADLGQSIAEGSELATYRFDRFKTVREEGTKEVRELRILVQDQALSTELQKGVDMGEVTAKAVKLARDLANTPSNEMTPTILAERARQVAASFGMKCEVYGRADIERMGMGGLGGVSKGSAQEPRFIVMEHRGGQSEEAPVVIVGKAITFDSGGISIKPADRMDEMKYDKSGGSAVIATMQAAAELRLPINLVGLVPATENLPSGTAMKPGDVIKTYGGKTVEVVNTDAEGRLILSDALAYSQKYKPAAIIDLATLTGACVIALGTITTGLFSNDQKLKERIKQAAEATDERVWELPLFREYYDQIKSEVADVKNVGGRPAGAITGAAFLASFVEKYAWAHLDIAGTAWTQEGSGEKPHAPKGATGVGVRLLVHLLRNWKS